MGGICNTCNYDNKDIKISKSHKAQERAFLSVKSHYSNDKYKIERIKKVYNIKDKISNRENPYIFSVKDKDYDSDSVIISHK